MRFADLLTPERVLREIVPGTKDLIFRQLLAPLVVEGTVANPDEVLEALLHRERVMSTAVKEGYALPHAFTRCVREPVAVVGLCAPGLDFDSLDGSATKCFLLLLEPELAHAMHLKLLAQLSRLLSDPGLLQRMLEAGSSEEVIDHLRAREDSYGAESARAAR